MRQDFGLFREFLKKKEETQTIIISVESAFYGIYALVLFCLFFFVVVVVNVILFNQKTHSLATLTRGSYSKKQKKNCT